MSGCDIADPCVDTRPTVVAPRGEAYLGLDLSQQAAVVKVRGTVDGALAHCSAVLVDARHLLSAAHCDLVFRADDAKIELAGHAVKAQVQRHPGLDLLVARLDDAAPSSVQPIGLVDASTRAIRPGALAVGAGYGDNGQGGADGQIFTVGRVIALDEVYIALGEFVDAGPCAGDSGGPVLVRGPQGDVRVAGVLHASTLDCQSRASYLRIDAVAEWIREQGVEDLAGPCGRLDAAGDCFDGRAIWCENERPRLDDCGEGDCGWSERARGWRCMAPSHNRCGAIDSRGVCEGRQLVRCKAGQLVFEDCEACGLSCQRDPVSYAVRCARSR